LVSIALKASPRKVEQFPPQFSVGQGDLFLDRFLNWVVFGFTDASTRSAAWRGYAVR